MILPIITAICREIFLQTPRLHEEAALALGATRWEMVRMTVFPYGRSGMVSAAMLGLGRALGETIAVAMVLSVSGVVTLQPDLQHQPGHDRRQHRPEVPRGQRHRGQRPDRHRTGAVRHHLRRQLPRPRRSSAAAKSSRGRTDMSTPVHDRTRPEAVDPVELEQRLHAPQLPRWLPRALVVGAVVLVVALRLACSAGTWALSVVAGWSSTWSSSSSSRGASRDAARASTGSPRRSVTSGVRARPAPAGHTALAGGQQRRTGARLDLPQQLHAQRRRRGRRHLPRHLGHDHRHHAGRRHVGPDRPAHRRSTSSSTAAAGWRAGSRSSST